MDKEQNLNLIEKLFLLIIFLLFNINYDSYAIFNNIINFKIVKKYNKQNQILMKIIN